MLRAMWVVPARCLDHRARVRGAARSAVRSRGAERASCCGRRAPHVRGGRLSRCSSGCCDGWSAAEYRLYWLFGAVLNVPYLAAGRGCTSLVKDRRVTTAAPRAAAVRDGVRHRAGPHGGARRRRARRGPPAGQGGRRAGDPLALDLARYFAFPAYFFLLGGTVWSAWRMRGRPELARPVPRDAAIAIGATIVAAGSAFALTGNFVGFSITLTLGIAVMFWGFLRASRPPAVSVAGYLAGVTRSDRGAPGVAALGVGVVGSAPSGSSVMRTSS